MDRPSPGPNTERFPRTRRAYRWLVSLVAEAVDRVASTVRGAIRALRRPAVRESALIGLAYVTGVVGLVVSIVGDPTDPQSAYGAAGIALMGIAFACLFVVSVSILRATGGNVGGDG